MELSSSKMSLKWNFQPPKCVFEMELFSSEMSFNWNLELIQNVFEMELFSSEMSFKLNFPAPNVFEMELWFGTNTSLDSRYCVCESESLVSFVEAHT